MKVNDIAFQSLISSNISYASSVLYSCLINHTDGQIFSLLYEVKQWQFINKVCILQDLTKPLDTD